MMKVYAEPANGGGNGNRRNGGGGVRGALRNAGNTVRNFANRIFRRGQGQ